MVGMLCYHTMDWNQELRGEWICGGVCVGPFYIDGGGVYKKSIGIRQVEFSRLHPCAVNSHFSTSCL